MTNLKRLVVTLSLITVLAVTAFAGETESPPCAPPDPGEMGTPPCSTAQQVTNDTTNPGETEAPPAAETVVISMIVDGAVGALLSIW